MSEQPVLDAAPEMKEVAVAAEAVFAMPMPPTPVTPVDNEDAVSVAGSEKSTASSRSAIPKYSGAARRPVGASGKTPPRTTATPPTSMSTSTPAAGKISRPCAGQLTKATPSPVTPSKNPTCFIRDLFEELDFFGNPLINYPPRQYSSRKDYSHDLFKEDVFKDYASNSSSYSHSYGGSSYSKPPKGLSRERSRSHSRERSRERSPSLRRTSLGSTGTASSMDALWELHPRRLSEAGLSRYSDNSTVLTEDTNSFIIGQRVFVGGTKPGQIAYIGETQFAPGEWAGIVLDQAIGKNDGSVGGTRYFQCEPKRGVFSRLTRLTRYPLGPDTSGGGGDISFCASPSPTSSVRKSSSPMMSPTASARWDLSTSNTSLATVHVDFKIGDRVIIKSGQGSKVGTLRYMGFAAFAPGEWCGVELDEPRGKNDGSVQGERYFECRPNYGLFAPLNKVSRSPSSRKPGNCVVHSSMRRANSRDSLMSLNSSMATASVASATPARRKSPTKSTSTTLPSRAALQDVLNEKQQHIEQLMKERDLERAEITKAASWADEAEQRYIQLQKDYELYRIDCERKVKDYATKVQQVEDSNKEIHAQLDEERAKNEDWQFKFEEAAITKADVESSNAEHLAKVKELQLLVSELQALHDNELAQLAKARDELATLKEENESLKVNLEHANEKRTSLEHEEIKSIELVQTLQMQLEEANSSLKQQQEIAMKQLADVNKELVRINAEHEVESFKLNKEIEELHAKYSHDINAKNDELILLTGHYEETKGLLENSQKEHDKQRYDSGVTEQGVRKELDKLRAEISAKVIELEAQHEQMRTKDLEVIRLEQELAKTQKNLEMQIKETETINMTNEDSAIELANLRSTLVDANAKVERLNTSAEERRDAGIKEMEEFNIKCNALQKQLNDAHKQLEAKTSEYDSLRTELNAVEKQLCEQNARCETNASDKLRLEEQLQLQAKRSEELMQKESQLVLELGDAQRRMQQLQDQLGEGVQLREKLETEIQQLIGSSGEESSKLEILNKELHSKQAQLEQCQKQFEQRTNDLQRSLQETQMNFESATAKAVAELQNLRAVNEKLRVEIQNLSDQRTSTTTAHEKLIADVKHEMEVMQQQLHERNTSLDQLQLELDQESKQKCLLETSLGEIKVHNAELLEKFNASVEEIAQLHEKHKHLSDQLQENSKSFESQNSESGKLVETLQVQFAQDKHTLQSTINEKEAALQELLSRVEELEKLIGQNDARSTESQLELDAVRQQCTELSAHAEELRVECDNGKQLLENAKEELAKLQQKYNEQGSKLLEKEHAVQVVQRYEIALLEKSNYIAKLESQWEEASKAVQSITTQIQSVKDREMQIITDLESKVEEVKRLRNALSSKEQEGKDVNANLLSKDEEIAKLQLELQRFESSNREEQGINTMLARKLEQLEKKFEEVCKKLDSADEKCRVFNTLLSAVMVTEEHKRELQMSKDIMNLPALKSVVDALKVHTFDKNLDRVQELEKMNNLNNEGLMAAHAKIKQQQNEIIVLQQDILKARMDSEKKVVATTKITDESQCNNNAPHNSNDYKQLLEEKLQAENQVEFLHSIIADMQKKNEEQKARIEILESGYSPAAADELKLMGVIQKKQAPRLWCDICEEFDQHETEDCPAQDDDDLPPPRTSSDGKKTKPPPRPYCEICEVFGHATDDCPEEETY